MILVHNSSTFLHSSISFGRCMHTPFSPLFSHPISTLFSALMRFRWLSFDGHVRTRRFIPGSSAPGHP